MRNQSTLRLFLGLVVAGASMIACGGEPKPPPETPASPPETTTEPSAPPAETEGSGDESEHTMPDGTKMPGHHHEEGAPAEEPEKSE